MKKNTITLLAAMLILSLSVGGCGGCATDPVVNPSPTIAPTATLAPTIEPTSEPTLVPTSAPVATPTMEPTKAPTPTEAMIYVTATPTPEATPTEEPTPTEVPTVTTEPTMAPTEVPAEPTEEPSPTPSPTPLPTNTPTPKPTSTPTPKPTATPTPSPSPTPTPVTVKGVKAGDYITYGNYEQDNDFGNGKEPIDWLVLEVKDGKAFLLSKYVLDGQKYHYDFVDRTQENHPYINVTWETCDLRAWMGSEFLNNAFTYEEQESIVLTTVVNHDSHTPAKSKGGNNTKDKVYLLSVDEVVYYFGSNGKLGGIPPKEKPDYLPPYFAEATDYAYEKDVEANYNSYRWYEHYATWFLRTPGAGNEKVAYVASEGILMPDGYNIIASKGIRPCMWLDLETAEFEKTE